MTSRRIEGHKNYYDLMRKHEEARRYGKLFKILKWLLFFGALVTVIVYYINFTNASQSELYTLKNGSFEIFEVNPTVGDTIITRSGSEIMIPANAFLDDDGKGMDEVVSVYYKEYRDAVDIALSDIPMNLTDDYMLESAGMFAIHAYHDEQELKTNKESLIRVNYLGKRHGDGYNNYYLNKKKEWVRVRPEIKRTRFKIMGNTKYFPQLKALEKVDWEFMEEPSDSILNLFFNEVWVYPSIAKNKGSFTLYGDVLIGKVRPLPFGKDSLIYLPSQLAEEQSDALMDEFSITDVKSPDGFFGNFKRLAQEAEKQPQKELETDQKLLDISTPYLKKESVMNSFYIKDFGTWNCDRPFPINEYITPDLQFVDSDKKQLDIKLLVAINHELNTVFRFRKGDPFKFKLGSVYTIFYIDEQSILHYCTTTLKVKSKRIKMKEHLLETISPENIKQILNIKEKEDPVSNNKTSINGVTSVKRPEKYAGKNVIWFEAVDFE